MVEMENNFRKLNPQEETGNKWGSIMFNQNNSGEENIVFTDYEYIKKK